MRIRTAATFLALALVASACGSSDGGSGGGGGDRAELIGDKGFDVCGLVSDETVSRLQSAAEVESEPVEDVFDEAPSFISCTVVSDVKISFAVRAVESVQTAESLVEAKYDVRPDQLPGVGDSAVIGTNTYDGVRIAATSGGQEVLVDSEFQDDGDRITSDDIVALAKEVVSNLGAERPAAIVLPRACPQPTAEKVEELVGTLVLARGAVAENGSVACRYVGDDRLMSLSAYTGDSGFNLMALGDSDPEDRVEVDGDQGLFDDEQLVVLSGKDCVLGASLSPFSDGLADQRPEQEIRDEAIDLVKYVKEEIGCPS